MTTLVLADDHAVVRQGLRALLEPEFRVLAETGDGLEAVKLVERLQPDVAVLDLTMPGLDGLDAARQIRRRAPGTSVIILTMHQEEAHVAEALKSGVRGYVLKGSDASELIRAIHECSEGRPYLSPQISERVIQGYVERFESSALDPYDTLTDREREVLHLAAEGLTNPEIGRRLSLSTRTVETHRAKLMHKLGLRNQAELTRYAIGRGFLDGRGSASPPKM
jgi:two-component system response regulator NreC